MRVLVLGGSGFIGGHVVSALVRDGHQVRSFSRTTEGLHPKLSEVEYRTGTIDDIQALAEALYGVEAVFHLISSTVPATAERDPVADVEGNLIGTLGLLTEMERQGVGRLIYLSSGGAVYGPPLQVPIPETHPLTPLGSYGIVKVAIEGFLSRQSGRGMVPVILRAANAYGPQQPGTGVQGFIGALLHRLAKGEPIELLGDGSVVRDFLHARDLADLCVRALLASEPVTVNAGSGRGTSLAEVIALAERISGRKVDLIRKPARATDTPVSVLDITRARRIFGWTPQITLEEGIAETWDWVQHQVNR